MSVKRGHDMLPSNQDFSLSTKGHKGGQWYVHKECIVWTAVYQKASLRLKQCQTVKKSSWQPYVVFIELCLSEDISQSVSYSPTQTIDYLVSENSYE